MKSYFKFVIFTCNHTFWQSGTCSWRLSAWLARSRPSSGPGWSLGSLRRWGRAPSCRAEVVGKSWWQWRQRWHNHGNQPECWAPRSCRLNWLLHINLSIKRITSYIHYAPIACHQYLWWSKVQDSALSWCASESRIHWPRLAVGARCSTDWSVGQENGVLLRSRLGTLA